MISLRSYILLILWYLSSRVSFTSFVLNFLVEYLPSVLQSHQEVIVGHLDGSSWRISSRGKEQLPELFCDNEEADSRLFMNASYCSGNTTVSRIVVFSSDTKVIVVACYHCNHLLQTCSEVWIRTSHAKKSQFIPIHRIYTTLREKICRVLPSFHCLTGCDFTGSFSGIGKRSHSRSLVKISTVWEHLIN